MALARTTFGSRMCKACSMISCISCISSFGTTVTGLIKSFMQSIPSIVMTATKGNNHYRGSDPVEPSHLDVT